MRKQIFASIIFLCASAFVISAQSHQVSEKPEAQSKWIAERLQEIKTIQVGNTRADLLKIFTTEGGISTALKRTFIYRKCPYIKVDVEFEAVGRAERNAEGRQTSVEDNGDRIKSISKPYLEWSIMN